MNRRQKIIVSVVGIFIVLLALVGITYGYFLTRIQGNTNTTSITVTTADLKLLYDDGSDGVIGGFLLEPQPTDSAPFTKTFTVFNDGNANIDYGVYLIDVINTFQRKNDIKYTMTCTTDGTEPCGKVESATRFPSGISELVTATIEPQKTHTYTFSFTYYDTGTDQSVDMNKELKAKIQIFGKNGKGLIIPFETDTLAYNIIDNASNSLNGTTLNLAPSSEAIVESQVSTSTEKVMATTLDDYGKSYYFRGSVENNYVNFAKMCWKIVRINGDGSVKLILEDAYAECDDKETTETEAVYTGNWKFNNIRDGAFADVIQKYPNKSIIDYLNHSGTSVDYPMSSAFENFQTEKLTSYLDDLKSGGWCLADNAYSEKNFDIVTTQPLTDSEKETIYNSGTWNGYYWTDGKDMYYDSYVRLIEHVVSPTLRCNGTVMNKFGDNTDMYVGTLTADEITYAGGKYNTTNDTYYLFNNYQKTNNLFWWTLSPSHFGGMNQIDSAFAIDYDGVLGTFIIRGNALNMTYRPSVNLVSSTVITGGFGTITEPYKIG